MENLYVHRGDGGEIKKLTARPNGSEELLPVDNPEVVEFNSPPVPTNEEIYDKTIQNQKLLKAVVLAINDGSFVPGGGLSGSELKSVILSKMP